MEKINKLTFLALMVVLTACATSVRFPTSQIAPAAEGSAKIRQDKNENYKVALTVKHLAAPERLSTPRSQYVAWMICDNGEMHNLGRVTPNRRLVANLETTTPHRPSEIMITAEDQGNLLMPGNQLVFTSGKIRVSDRGLRLFR